MAGGVARTPAQRRLKSPFRTGFDTAIANVAKSLRLFQKEAGIKIEHVVLSTNVDLLCAVPADPGTAAWFMLDNQWTAFGVDRFLRVEANIQAIHHIIEARRVELRYGGLAIVRQTFRAFLALPGPAWWETLGVPHDASARQIESAYKSLAMRHHPDKSGDPAMMAAARASALKAVSV
jgi:DnaJ domain